MESGGQEVRYGELMWRALRRRRWLAVAVFLAVAGPMLVYPMLMEPRYESTGTVWVEERTLPVFDAAPPGRLYVLLTILGSRSLAASVVDALPRRAYDELVRNRNYTDWSMEISSRIRRLLGKPAVAVSPREQVISELINARMAFRPQGNSGIVQVTATASDPTTAADIASAYIETLRSKTRFFTREEARAVREFLEAQAKQVGATLQAAQDALLQWERQRGAMKVDDRVAQSLGHLDQAEGSLAAVALAEEITRTRLTAIKTQLEGQPAAKKVTGSITVTPALKDLVERWRKAEEKLAGLTQRYTDAYPGVAAAREEAHQLSARVDAAMRESLRIAPSPNLPPLERAPLIEQAIALAEDIAKVQPERDAYEGRVRTLRGSLSNLNQEQYEFARRRQAVESTNNLSALLAQKAEEASIRGQDNLRDIRVLDPPSVPVVPSGRAALKLLLVGLGLGLAAACGLPLGLELMDTTIKTEDEVEAILGWPVLGTIQAMTVRPPLANGARARRALPSSGPADASRRQG